MIALPAVLALALSTIASACFGLVIRFAQGMGSNMVAVGAVNYLTATVVNLSILLIGGSQPPHLSTIILGVAGGALYASAFYPVLALTRLRGASVTGAVMRLSSVVPVGVSLLAWGEHLTGMQTAGAAVALASLPLLTLGRAVSKSPAALLTAASAPGAGGATVSAANAASAPDRRGTILLLGLFVMNGLCLLTPRTFRATSVVGEEAAFLSMLFASAATTSCTVWAVSERRARRRSADAAGGRAAAGPLPNGQHEAGLPGRRHPLLLDVVPGIVIGACNALSNRFIVLALQRLPGSIVYPFYSAVGLLVTVIVSRAAWRERFGVGGSVGLLLAGASIVLVNLGAGAGG